MLLLTDFFFVTSFYLALGLRDEMVVLWLWFNSILGIWGLPNAFMMFGVDFMFVDVIHAMFYTHTFMILVGLLCYET